MRCWPAVLSLLCGLAADAQPLSTDRQQQLVRMVRQDCGSCHGLHLTGGLGPALTNESLRGQSPETLSAVIRYGRPGTPMPGWAAMLSQDEADWIAAQLLAGFPQEARTGP